MVFSGRDAFPATIIRREGAVGEVLLRETGEPTVGKVLSTHVVYGCIFRFVVHMKWWTRILIVIVIWTGIHSDVNLL